VRSSGVDLKTVLFQLRVRNVIAEQPSNKQIVAEEMSVASKLIEHVGQRIVDRLKNELAGITKLKIKVTKICPPINGDVDNVAIIIED
jgi:dihydroneopterin aldolase